MFKSLRETSTSYSLKNYVVDSVIKDSGSDDFNVYYQMPPGINNGHDYLFKWKGKPPQDGAKNLYILEFANPTQFNPGRYYLTFKNKEIKIQTADLIHIISIK